MQEGKIDLTDGMDVLPPRVRREKRWGHGDRGVSGSVNQSRRKRATPICCDISSAGIWHRSPPTGILAIAGCSSGSLLGGLKSGRRLLPSLSFGGRPRPGLAERRASDGRDQSSHRPVLDRPPPPR